MSSRAAAASPLPRQGFGDSSDLSEQLYFLKLGLVRPVKAIEHQMRQYRSNRSAS